MDRENKGIVFITGGARSGKSAFALKEASKVPGGKAYIATAEALDQEMKQRIEEHKKVRGNEWDTYEEPTEIGRVLSEIKGRYKVIVIDCLTLWLSNLMHNNKDTKSEIESFCISLSTVPCQLFTVSNEVGMGIVPENPMAREFRDMAGFLNQKIAEIADDAYLITAGIAIKIKNSK